MSEAALQVGYGEPVDIDNTDAVEREFHRVFDETPPSDGAEKEPRTAFPLIRLDAKDFRARLKKLKPFMSTEETRYYLNGIYFHYINQQLTLCATNGHILQEQVFDAEVELSENLEPFTMILPRTAVAHLIKVIPTGKDASFFTMQVLDDGKNVRFDFFEFEYLSSTVNGTFPDYHTIVPRGAETMQGGLNAGYLIDVLKALNNSAVDICIDNKDEAKTSPHLLTSPEAAGVRCVIMPMRF